jgi:hypothetical protein
MSSKIAQNHVRAQPPVESAHTYKLMYSSLIASNKYLQEKIANLQNEVEQLKNRPTNSKSELRKLIVVKNDDGAYRELRREKFEILCALLDSKLQLKEAKKKEDELIRSNRQLLLAAESQTVKINDRKYTSRVQCAGYSAKRAERQDRGKYSQRVYLGEKRST